MERVFKSDLSLRGAAQGDAWGRRGNLFAMHGEEIATLSLAITMSFKR